MIKSPCINICELNSDGICVGCYRNMYEIRCWKEFTEEEKKCTLEKVGQRELFDKLRELEELQRGSDA